MVLCRPIVSRGLRKAVQDVEKNAILRMQSKGDDHGYHLTSHSSYRRNRCCDTVERCERERSPPRDPRRVLVRHSLVLRVFGLGFALLLPLRPSSLPPPLRALLVTFFAVAAFMYAAAH
jgi:hypothetical protein